MATECIECSLLVGLLCAMFLYPLDSRFIFFFIFWESTWVSWMLLSHGFVRICYSYWILKYKSHGKTNIEVQLCAEYNIVLIFGFWCTSTVYLILICFQVCAAWFLWVLYWVYSWAEEKTYQFVPWIQVLHKAAPAKACWCYNEQLCHQMTQYSWDLVQLEMSAMIISILLLAKSTISDRNRITFTEWIWAIIIFTFACVIEICFHHRNEAEDK